MVPFLFVRPLLPSKHFLISRSLRRLSTACPNLVKFPWRRPQAAIKNPNQEQLRDLYEISAQPDIDLSIKTAKAAVHSLQKFLENTPVPEHTRQAFAEFLAWRQRPDSHQSLFLDAGCGRGWSTARIARRFPQCDVIGVDRSGVKLSRNAAYRHGGFFRDVPNAFLLRADLVHFWRLCWEHQIVPQKHFLLYPNPYPKKSHLRKRWHGHSIFPVVVALSGTLEVRASWPGYLEEFRSAYITACDTLRSLSIVDLPQVQVSDVQLITGLKPCSMSRCDDGDDAPLSSFEAKYVQVGQPVYRLSIHS